MDRIIKGFSTQKFEVELLQDIDGRYYIRYMTHNNEKFSEFITDFGTASYLFDLKIQELEGQ